MPLRSPCAQITKKLIENAKIIPSNFPDGPFPKHPIVREPKTRKPGTRPRSYTRAGRAARRKATQRQPSGHLSWRCSLSRTTSRSTTRARTAASSRPRRARRRWMASRSRSSLRSRRSVALSRATRCTRKHTSRAEPSRASAEPSRASAEPSRAEPSRANAAAMAYASVGSRGSTPRGTRARQHKPRPNLQGYPRTCAAYPWDTMGLASIAVRAAQPRGRTLQRLQRPCRKRRSAACSGIVRACAL